MNALLAGLILYIAVAYATSAVAFLPAAALAEALPARSARREVVLWLLALLTPHLAALAAVIYAARLHEIDPVPWVMRREWERHISFWWLAGGPDAAYRIKFVAVIAGALAVLALIRPAFSALLAWRYSRTLTRSSTHIAELDVWLTPLERPWSTCVGFLETRVYVTQGAAQLLAPDELASVLAHEQAHADRRDNLRLLLAQAALGPLIVWPPARYAFRRLQGAIERAADQASACCPADQETLASALVKAARKLRDFHPDPDEETLRRRMGSRYREEFVAERAQELLDSAEPDTPAEPRSRAIRLALSAGTFLFLALLIGAIGFVGPTVRSLYEGLLAGLGRG